MELGGVEKSEMRKKDKRTRQMHTIHWAKGKYHKRGGGTAEWREPAPGNQDATAAEGREQRQHGDQGGDWSLKLDSFFT